MYRCHNCKADFKEPKLVYGDVPYGETIVRGLSTPACPFCGGECEEAEVCELCGDTFFKSQHNGVCQSCIDVITKRFSDLLKEKFTDFEISILNAAYDGRNLE